MEKGKENRVVFLGEDDEQSEEEKMEKFFALIRDFRDACNRRRKELVADQEMRKRKLVHHHIRDANVWVPCFQWEDFAEEVEFKTTSPSLTTAPCEKNKDEAGGGGLDLKLTL